MNLDDVGYLEDFPSFVEGGTPLCSETDPDMFFPVDQPDSTRKVIEFYTNEREAKAVCAQCPYKLECLAYALDRIDVQGIWGATTQMDRRRMLRRLRSQKTARML